MNTTETEQPMLAAEGLTKYFGRQLGCRLGGWSKP